MALIDRLRERRVYLDSNIFIYAFEDYPAYHEDCAGILDALDNGLIYAVASELVFVEVLYRPLESDIELAEQYVDALERCPGLLLAPITRSIILRAAALRVRERLATPDAIHLATAIENGCEAVVTNDRNVGSSQIEIIRLTPRRS